MRTRVFVAAVAVVALGVVAATAGASGQHRQANKLTVWLQVDAQSGWPDVVAAANAQFQQDHPGYTVDVQYQNWSDHLQKFDATLAGGNSPDVIEMGNTEMTKYMAAGAFADITSSKSVFDNSANWLKGLAASGVYGGYFGAAQGVLMIGLLGIFLDESLQRVNGLKNVLTGVVNGVAAVVFIALTHVAWLLAALIAVGSTIGGLTGARYGRRLPPMALRVLVVIIGVVSAVRLIFF